MIFNDIRDIKMNELFNDIIKQKDAENKYKHIPAEIVDKLSEHGKEFFNEILNEEENEDE